ncbi:MAG: hypothetical protein JWN70_7220 [Planctomycetaceae bacterium]|nr:hypothetical protein [Planctomycetaceae bacterium]
MRDQLNDSLGTIKTTALGGLLFLIPIVVNGIALGYVYRTAAGSYHHVRPWVPFDSATGIVVVFCLAIVVVLLACFAFGLIARRAIGRHFSQTIEQQLIKVYPKYAIFKDLLAGHLGGDENVPSLRPVQVWSGGLVHLAFEADRLGSGLVVIYFPGAPDTWNGSIALAPAEHVRPIDVPFNQLLGICERLGRQSSSLLAAVELGQEAKVKGAADSWPVPEHKASS